jgi:4-diphosphocytidyl-2-C-methyl-D-erythritol kinase
MSDCFTLPAFAKVNLMLRVLGRRADGYHEIETVFQTITLHDRLTFEANDRREIEIVCDAPGVPGGPENLVHRAAAALRERYGMPRGARITLEKNIPAQGGLGGGSADAAVALIGLARLWKVAAETEELAVIGARLGSDVPFFLTGGTALGRGTGTIITPLPDVPETPLVVVTPEARVSTAEGYKALNARALTKGEAAANLSVSRAESRISGSLCEVMRNDFEAVILGMSPEVGRAREALLRAGARCALLSGSGSSLFGVFDSKGEAERARAALGAESVWHVHACATLSRAGYLGALGRSADPGGGGREA